MEKKLLFLLLCTLLAGLYPTHQSFAAGSIYTVSPAAGTYVVGSVVKTSVIVSAQGKNINAGEATLHFPSDLLTPSNITKGSVFSFWQTSPTLSSNTIRFVGGRLGGFNGTGAVFTVSFRVKKEGVAILSLSNANILAADGEGTNVMEGALGARWNLVPGVSQAPQKPTISSPTHPDQEQWYSNNQPQFEWQPPSGIESISFDIDQNPESTPTRTYSPQSNFKPEKVLEDGIWYFHLRYRNNAGWSETSHFTTHIDTTPPNIQSIKLLDGEQTIQRHPLISIEATDIPSGIRDIGSSINKEPKNPLVYLEGSTYELPLQTPGNKEVRFIVTDNAGNEAIHTKLFSVTQEAPDKIKIVERYKYLIPWFMWVAISILLLFILLLILLLFWKRHTKNDPPPTDHEDPPMYEVT